MIFSSSEAGVLSGIEKFFFGISLHIKDAANNKALKMCGNNIIKGNHQYHITVLYFLTDL